MLLLVLTRPEVDVLRDAVFPLARPPPNKHPLVGHPLQTRPAAFRKYVLVSQFLGTGSLSHKRVGHWGRSKSSSHLSVGQSSHGMLFM